MLHDTVNKILHSAVLQLRFDQNPWLTFHTANDQGFGWD